MFDNPAWFRQANCRGLDHNASFMPPQWDTYDAEEAAALDREWYDGPDGALAKTICRNCVVRDLCFDYALDDPHTIANGVFGGTTPQDRHVFLEAISVRGGRSPEGHEGTDQG